MGGGPQVEVMVKGGPPPKGFYDQKPMVTA